jgi:hypothetical protein
MAAWVSGKTLQEVLSERFSSKFVVLVIAFEISTGMHSVVTMTTKCTFLFYIDSFLNS